MQDPNWSELVKYCAARGAYRGAGSESLGLLVRNQPADDSYLPGEDQGNDADIMMSFVLLALPRSSFHLLIAIEVDAHHLFQNARKQLQRSAFSTQLHHYKLSCTGRLLH